MAYAVYATEWGDVKLSPSEALNLDTWLRLERDCVEPPYSTLFERNVAPKLAAKIADIERVAKWKYGHGE